MSVGKQEPGGVDQAQGELLPLNPPSGQAGRRKARVDQHTPAPQSSPNFDAIDANPSAEDAITEALGERLRLARASGKVPLFVLGAGISADCVPFLSDIADWFLLVGDWRKIGKLKVEVEAPTERMDEFLRRLSGGKASRADAAELFSMLQSPSYAKLWTFFSKAFLLGPTETSVPSLTVGKEKADFVGLLTARPSPAHLALAKILHEQEGHVFSLNFDGLTSNALTETYGKGIALHTQKQVNGYFCAARGGFVPSVIKVRGDVFYAKCSEPACPAANEEHPLDRLHNRTDLRCPACGQDTVVLQFSFPGYRLKEEVAYPILWEARRFLAQRLSAIIIVGLSGRWDRYLLDFLFDLAVERGLIVCDVKPEGADEAVINSFRQTYYPSCVECSEASSLPLEGSCYIRIHSKANAFLSLLLQNNTHLGGPSGAAGS